MKIITYNSPGPFDIDMFGDFDLFLIQRCCQKMLQDIPYQHNYIQNYQNDYGSEAWFSEGEGRGLCIVSKNTYGNVSTGKFSWWSPEAQSIQGKHWQIITIDIDNIPYKFVNGLSSFPSEGDSRFGLYKPPIHKEHQEIQTTELLDLVDNNTILMGDFHIGTAPFWSNPENFLSNLEFSLYLEQQNLIDHVNAFTFCDSSKKGHWVSIDRKRLAFPKVDFWYDAPDKIITTKDTFLDISNVFVIQFIMMPKTYDENINITESKDIIFIESNEKAGYHWPIRFDVNVKKGNYEQRK